MTYKSVIKNFLLKNFPRSNLLLNEIYYKKAFNIKNIQKNKLEIDNIIESIKSKNFYNISKNFNKEIEKSSDYATLEINNTCNIDCLMCKTSLASRQKGKIRDETISLILDRFKVEGVKIVNLHTIGDPLMSTKLEESFIQLRQRNMKANIATNGLLLKRHIDTFKKYVDVCNTVRFSIDGATQETYEKIRSGGKWDVLLENLKLAKKELAPLGIRLSIIMCISKDNVHEIGKYINLFSKYLLRPERDFEFTIMNSLSPDNTYFKEMNLFPTKTYPKMNCHYINGTTLYGHFNAKLSLCCRDYDGSLEIGDLSKNTVKEIKSMDKFKNIRKEYYSNNFKNLPQCGDCFIVDPRILEAVRLFFKIMLFEFKNRESFFYDKLVASFFSIFQYDKNLNNYKSYSDLINTVKN